MDLGVYVHIPFCKSKCYYCDFPSYARREELYDNYVDALVREIAEQSILFPQRTIVDTVYIGGGTPTVLNCRHLERLLAALRQWLPLSVDAEITAEANPATVDAVKMALLRDYGVNRLSIGAQSFNDGLLQDIGRLHTAAQAAACVEMAARAGFANINIDLMYGLPRQSVSDVAASLTEVARLPVRHVAVYGLQVETGTVFAERRQQGRLVLPDEDVEFAMYEYITETLPKLGFRRYEISNYAVEGYESRHNNRYWRCREYRGFGAAAHSFIAGRRFANTGNVEQYIEAIADGVSPEEESVTLDIDMLMEEFCFLALRLAEGIDARLFEERFGLGFYEIYGNAVAKLTAQGLLRQEGRGVALTQRGMRYGNRAFCEFLLKK